MPIKPSIGQIVNPYQLQDGADTTGFVSYPLPVGPGLSGGTNSSDPVILDIDTLSPGTPTLNSLVPFSEGGAESNMTLSDLATLLDKRSVYSVADITTLNAITGMDLGDVAIVADTFDLTGENVAGSFVYNGTSWLLESRYAVALNNLLDVNAPSPVAGDILQRDGSAWVNVANAFAPLNGTPTEIRYYDNTGVDHSDSLATRDSVTNYTEIAREYDSTANITTVTSPVSFLTTNTNGTFTIGDQVETWLGEAQGEVLDIGTVTTTEPSYSNLTYTGVGLNDLTSIYVGGYTGGYPVSYTIEILQNNVAYASIGGVSGTLSIGDTITGLTSGATAVIVAIDTFKNILAVDTIVGTFIPSETVQGNTPSDFVSIGGDFSTLADIALISNTNANSIITTIAPTSQLEGLEVSFSSFTGHTIGDTRTFDVNATTTFTIVYLTNITGTLPIGINTRLNNLTTPFQTDDGNIIAAQFTVGDTVDVIDLSAGFTQVGQIHITQVSGQTFTYTLNSGTISIGNYLYAGTQGKQGFVYDINSTTVTTTIKTGFETNEIQFPNIPFALQGSALISDNGSDVAGIGVFNLTPFGQEDAVPAIIKFYADSSQGTFQVTKDIISVNGFDATSNRSFDGFISPTEISLQGYDGSQTVQLSVTQTQFSYRTNGGTSFIMPNTYNGPVSVMTDMSGNGNITMEPLSSLVNITPTNGLQTIGSDIGLGGTLIQDTIIQPSVDGAFSLTIGDNNRLAKFNVNALDNINITSLQNTNIKGISAIIDVTNDYIVQNSLGDRLIESNLPTKSITIGDVYGSLNNVSQTIDNNINATYSVKGFNFGQGIFADFINKLFVLGDVQNAVGNGNKVKVDDGNQLTTLGDGVNGTFIKINDAAQRIELNTSTGEYRVLTSPPSATTQTEALVRDTVTGILYVKDLSSLYTSNISIKTSNYSVVATDQGNIIHIDNSATGIDITLPDPSTVRVGKVFKFKAVGNSANTVRFIPFGSENIDGTAGAYTWSNPAGWQFISVYTDGVNRFIS